jgi:hypothetical protein
MRTTGAILASAFALSLSARAAEKVPSPASFLIDDFEDGDRFTTAGAPWAPFSDAVIGGASTVTVSVAGPKGGRSLHVEGNVAEKGFAGTWVAIDTSARAVDLREFRALRLRLKGAGEWIVGLRAGAARQDNFMAKVEGTESWTNVEIPLSTLRSKDDKSPDLGDVRWLGIQTAVGRTGAFAFDVDDVSLLGATRPLSPHGAAMQNRVKRTPASALAKAAWTPIGTDPQGDGKAANLPDILALASWTDGGTVWFRLSLAAPAGPAFGLNLVFEVGPEPAKTPWWGVNTAFTFDRIATAWVLETNEDTFIGTIGMATADGAMKGAMIDEALGVPKVAVSADGREIYVGLSRSALGGGGRAVKVLAAVGSPMKHNDDLPDAGTLTMTP